MTMANHRLTGLLLSLALSAVANTAFAADPGVITKQSRYSVKETVERFEAAVKAKEANGFMVFTELDHADAAKKFGARHVAAYGYRVRQPEIRYASYD